MSKDSILRALYEALYARRIEDGRKLLREHASEVFALPPGDPSTARWFLILSCWMEFEPEIVPAVRRLAEAYRQSGWPHLSIWSWGWIEGGLARYAYLEGNNDELARAVRWIEENQLRFDASPELLGTVYLTMAQALKRRTLPESALPYARLARACYEQAELPGMVAVTDVTLGWLTMQAGKLMEAARNWQSAWKVLVDTDDWKNIGNVQFYQARQLARAGRDFESRKAHKAAIGAYFTCIPTPRTVLPVLLSLSDLETRMAGMDLAHASELNDSAAKHLRLAEELLSRDADDIRNLGRTWLVKSNRAIYGPRRSLRDARAFAKNAFECVKGRQDQVLIAARALLRLATVEERASLEAEYPYRYLCQSARYATSALALAASVQDDRLTARCHRHLGGLFLREPFFDLAAAREHGDAAAKCVAKHDDCDYLVKRIHDLRAEVAASRLNPDDAIIWSITEERAFHNRLEETVQDAEHAIVDRACHLLGDRGLDKALGAGKNRIEKHLAARREKQSDATDQARSKARCFELRTSFVFSHKLEETTQALERAVIRGCCKLHDFRKRDVQRMLHIRLARLNRHFSQLILERVQACETAPRPVWTN